MAQRDLKCYGPFHIGSGPYVQAYMGTKVYLYITLIGCSMEFVKIKIKTNRGEIVETIMKKEAADGFIEILGSDKVWLV